jgi:hypothetical protein
MPLIANQARVGSDRQPSEVRFKELSTVEEEHDAGYEAFEDFVDEFLRSDMEASILDLSRAKQTHPPALPQRSDRRLSRAFEIAMVELKSLDGSTTQKEVEQETEVSDPHERYLSSEEDASLSDDSESLLEFESSSSEMDSPRAPPSRASSKKSQEDMATVVSFTAVGKPRLIEISPNFSVSKTQEPVSFDTASIAPLPKRRRPVPIMYPSPLRYRSVSSTGSTQAQVSNTVIQPQPHESNASPPSLPPRKSSRAASNVPTNVAPTKHEFMISNPFPVIEAEELSLSNFESSSESTAVTPKTPITMAAAAWKTGLNRTLSKARKHSMPRMSLAYTAGVVAPRTMSKPGLADMIEEEEPVELDPWKQRQRSATTPQTPHEGPVRYADIMGNARKPAPYIPGHARNLSLGMRGLTRRKSVRGRSDRYLGQVL